MPWLCGCWVGMGVEVCKIFEVPMSDRLILFLLQNTRFILFLCETKPRNRGTACSAEQGFAFRFCIARYGILASSCGLWHLWITLNESSLLILVFRLLSLSAITMVLLMKIRREASNLSRSFTVVLHIFFKLQFSLCDVHWISQWIHTFTLDSFKLSSIYN